MSSNNILLEPLVEPALPVSISMWPQTIGWQVLLTIALIAFCVYLYRQIKLWISNKYRRDAINKLQGVEALSINKALVMINRTLKEAAVVGYGVRNVASLHGSEWLEFLDGTSANSFVTEQTKLWQLAIYDDVKGKQMTDKDIANLAGISRQWIKTHEVSHD